MHGVNGSIDLCQHGQCTDAFHICKFSARQRNVLCQDSVPIIGLNEGHQSITIMQCISWYVARGRCISTLLPERGLTLSQTTKFRFFQTERVCRQQFRFDENVRKFCKWVENTVGKGEIARYETRHVKTRAVWERIKYD